MTRCEQLYALHREKKAKGDSKHEQESGNSLEQSLSRTPKKVEKPSARRVRATSQGPSSVCKEVNESMRARSPTCSLASASTASTASAHDRRRSPDTSASVRRRSPSSSAQERRRSPDPSGEKGRIQLKVEDTKESSTSIEQMRRQAMEERAEKRAAVERELVEANQEYWSSVAEAGTRGRDCKALSVEVEILRLKEAEECARQRMLREERLAEQNREYRARIASVGSKLQAQRTPIAGRPARAQVADARCQTAPRSHTQFDQKEWE